MVCWIDPPEIRISDVIEAAAVHLPGSAEHARRETLARGERIVERDEVE
jgi:hypothetical protein